MELYGLPIDIAIIVAAISGSATWLAQYFRDRHNRRGDIVNEYTTLIDSLRKREEQLLARITELETKLDKVQNEIIRLSSLLQRG